MHRILILAIALLILMSATPPAIGQGRPDPAKLIAAQQEAMLELAMMDGVWRGPAWTILPNGEKHNLTQTERVGTMLDGTVRVVEGRGYEADGSLSFNAFATISYDPAADSYTMHSHAQGQVGDFRLTPTGTGYAWEIPIGTMTIRYVAVIIGDTLREVGDRIIPGRDPIRFFEMNLKRIGDTDWPAGGAVGPE